MPPLTEEQIREQHSDWTDEQVKAELAKQTDPAPTPPATDPPRPDPADAAFARERRAREDAERRAKEAEAKLAEEARKKAEEEGRWKDLAEEERQKREALEAKQAEADQRRNAERSAGDLKFKDPGYALYILQQDQVDLADPAAVKTALEQLATNRTDLISGTAPPPSGGPAGGSNGEAPPLTRGDIQKMSAAQVAALDPEVLNKALATP